MPDHLVVASGCQLTTVEGDVYTKNRTDVCYQTLQPGATGHIPYHRVAIHIATRQALPIARKCDAVEAEPALLWVQIQAVR